jgi:membrane-bound hydrogenase subunit alpha
MPEKPTKQDDSFIIPIGPQHPALKEFEYFELRVDGEEVLDVSVRLGYNHRGIEKAIESRTYGQNLYLVERICGICSHAHTTCYCQALEQLLEVEIPDRARYIRTLVAELERIHSHLLWLGIAAHEIGFDTLFMYVWADREIVMDLLELISGNRVNYAMNTIGGVTRDVRPEISDKIITGIHQLEARAHYYKGMCLEEGSVMQRVEGVGVLRLQDALDLCAVGPTMRACGLASDLRKDDPYAAYDALSFDVITYDGGDVGSRMLVRIDEVPQSVHIIEQCIQQMPQGPLHVKVPSKVPSGEAVSRVEAPRGELIHYARSNGSDQPERYKVRAPTFANMPALSKMLIGAYIADVPIIIAGIDPCFGCLDRMSFVDVRTGRNWVWSSDQLRRRAEAWRQRA